MKLSITQIITLILSSSVLSAILTSVANWLIQKENYQKEYYKKILDKRLEAYGIVEHIESSLKLHVRLDNSKLCPAFCASGKQEFDNLIIKVAEAINISFWLSSEISNKLTEINVYLLQEIEDKIDDNGDVNIQLAEIGTEKIEDIRKLRKELTTFLYNDFKSLHNVRKFIRKPKKIERFIIYSKESDLLLK